MDIKKTFTDEESGETFFVEKRKRILTKADLEAIAAEFKSVNHVCDCPVDKEDLVESIKFYKNINSFFDGTKKKTWDIILTSLILGAIGLIGAGFWNKLNH